MRWAHLLEAAMAGFHMAFVAEIVAAEIVVDFGAFTEIALDVVMAFLHTLVVVVECSPTQNQVDIANLGCK